MNGKPFLKRITIYPVKSLDGVELQNAVISEGGCLKHDRQFAIVDYDGNYVNGKSNALVHSLRSKFNFNEKIFSLRTNDDEAWKNFNSVKEIPEIEKYLSAYFGFPVRFVENNTGRFMDIPDIAGLTVLSTPSLERISNWYEGMSVDETRRRFRATIEVDNVPAFWEDNLFSSKGTGVEFTIGNIIVYGMTPRERCVVPTRNTLNGEVTHAFPKIFARHRAQSLPEWSKLNEYGHHYYLTVNCFVPPTEIGKRINVGDEVSIVGERKFY